MYEHLLFQSEVSGVDNWHGLMEAQQGPAVNNLNNPIEPAVQQVVDLFAFGFLFVNRQIQKT